MNFAIFGFSKSQDELKILDVDRVARVDAEEGLVKIWMGKDHAKK